jgi:hypothetical protein
MDPRTPYSPVSSRLRRWALRANLLAAILLAVVLFGMVNYLSMRHYDRAHWRRNPFTELSGKSLQLLESVVEDIRVVALLRPSHDAYRSATALLQEYAARAPNLTVEVVDPDRDMAHTEQIASEFRLTGSECVVFEIGGRHQTVSAADLIEHGAPAADDAPPRSTFRGEQLFSSAIYALTQSTRPVVYFIQGHGERSPLDFDRRSGYSRIAARLRDDNLDVALLNLGEAKSVPENCALMIVAGPAKEFAPFEIALLRDYLDRKGRLLLLLDARTRTGLEPLLLEWGALLGDDIVVDESHTLSGRDLFVTAYPGHAITDPLQNLASVFFLPRSMRPQALARGGDKPAVTPLATCSERGWAEFDPDDLATHFDPQVDLPGPVPIAVAIERGPVPGVHVQIRPTRLVVMGDSDFAANSGIMGANADLFMNSVNWLLDREELLSLSPKTFEEFRLVMDARQLRQLFWIVAIILPGIVAGLGFWIAWRRRH